MQSSDWAPQHSAALREYLARGLSYSEIANAINAKFGTDYTRNAVIGRGRRLGLGRPRQAEDFPRPPKNVMQPSKRPQAKAVSPDASPGDSPESGLARPIRERKSRVKLRCVGIAPRLLPLTELGPDDCRYPYGGDKDGETIVFCGHPRMEGSSYCEPHFRLTQGEETAEQREIIPLVLRLVAAA
jgi:GcrA cell cycle regulator